MKNRELLKFVWDCLRKYKYKIFALQGFNFLFFYFIPNYILPYLTKIIGDQYSANILKLNTGIKIAILYAFLYSLYQIWHATFRRILIYRSEHQIMKDVRINLFEYVIQHSMGYFNDHMAGVLANKINNIVNNVVSFQSRIFALLSNGIILVILLVIYAKVNIFLMLFLAIWFISFFIFNYMVMGKINKVLTPTIEENNAVVGIMNDDFSNIMNIKLFSNQRRELYKIRKQGIHILTKESEFYKTVSIVNFIIFLFFFILTFGIIGGSYYALHIKQITLGTFLFICQNLFFIKEGLDEVINTLLSLLSQNAEMKDGLSTLLKPIEKVERANARELKNIHGKIVFSNIEFSYRKNS